MLCNMQEMSKLLPGTKAAYQLIWDKVALAHERLCLLPILRTRRHLSPQQVSRRYMDQVELHT